MARIVAVVHRRIIIVCLSNHCELPAQRVRTADADEPSVKSRETLLPPRPSQATAYSRWMPNSAGMRCWAAPDRSTILDIHRAKLEATEAEQIARA